MKAVNAVAADMPPCIIVTISKFTEKYTTINALSTRQADIFSFLYA